MKKRKAVLLVVKMAIALGIGLYAGCHETTEEKIKKVQSEVDDKKDEINRVYYTVQKEQQDSIKHFNAQSDNYQLLLKKRQEKDSTQTQIANIVEKSLREYWVTNFPRYCAYIDSCFTDAERAALSQYMGKAYFTLSCGIDHNVYKTMDEILYGPYWREFVEYFKENFGSLPRVIKKYELVRKKAESIYTYIYPRSVFYDGGCITICPDSPSKTDVVFSDAILNGREILRAKSSKPDSCMAKFNSLRNVSNIFTADVHYMTESLFKYTSEYYDLNCPLFAKHREELKQLVLHIIALDLEIKRCENTNAKDIKQLEDHFKTVELARYEQLRVEMEILQKQLKGLERQ